jgi:hypothetical protein
MELEDARDGLVRAYGRARWRWIVVAWGAIYLYDATRHCIDALRDGRAPSTGWLIVSASSLALWGLVTPLMLWLGRRVPLEDGARGIAIHVAALVAILLTDAAVQKMMWGDQDRYTYLSRCLGLLMIDTFSYATVVAIGHVQRANARDRARVRAQAKLDQELTTARLRALEMQLQPHFLFNTLHAVGALVRSARADDAVRSLATLGGLLRATLTDGSHEIPLGEELALADRYLELQQIRFADRLHVQVEIARGTERALVPRLILQPLLENAIRHGVERSRTAVAVVLQARAHGDRLELLVRDHGGEREAAAPGQGIGLANTRARLATLYGAAHRLAITPTDGGGREIRIEVPLAFAPLALELDGELRGEPA